METDMRKTRESRQAKLEELNSTIAARNKREENIRAKEADLRRAVEERDSQTLSTTEADTRKRVKEVEVKLAQHNEWRDGLETRRSEVRHLTSQSCAVRNGTLRLSSGFAVGT
jgi:septal ring factor EnvC (AmiA/AmiB activator)